MGLTLVTPNKRDGIVTVWRATVRELGFFNTPQHCYGYMFENIVPQVIKLHEQILRVH